MQLSPNSEAIFLAAWNNKGYALYRAGKHSEAIECYDKVSEINPNFSGLWVNKGAALQMLERYEEAIICYDKALEIALNYAEAWYYKGLALDKLERCNKFGKHFSKVRGKN